LLFTEFFSTALEAGRIKSFDEGNTNSSAAPTSCGAVELPFGTESAVLEGFGIWFGVWEVISGAEVVRYPACEGRDVKGGLLLFGKRVNNIPVRVQFEMTI
jgi:hypothetical protein